MTPGCIRNKSKSCDLGFSVVVILLGVRHQTESPAMLEALMEGGVSGSPSYLYILI